MVKVEVKPISVNGQYQGRRFLTPAGKKFKDYSKALILKGKSPAGKLLIRLEFGFSNASQDADGPSKSCIDIIAERYGFNDNAVYRVEIEKKIVPKGKEYWAFEILPYVCPA